jgi:TetR/AcrR family transcriptional repressor of mexJK operon
MANELQSPRDAQPRRPLGRPKAEDAAGLEAHLIDVGRRAFFDRGYGATTMDSIRLAARCSKTTLYKRFPSKSSLFRAIVNDAMAKWSDEPAFAPPEDADTLETSLRWFADLSIRAALSEDFSQLNRLLFSESRRFPELAEALAKAFEAGLENVTRIIADFAARDGVPCHNPERAAEYFLTSIAGWTDIQVVTNRTPSADERKAWVEEVVRLFIAGRTAW